MISSQSHWPDLWALSPSALCCSTVMGRVHARLDLPPSPDDHLKGISLSKYVSNFTPSKAFLWDDLHYQALISPLGSGRAFLGC